MKTILRIAAFVSIFSLARAAVELVPVRIDETRSLIIHDDNVSRSPAGLTLTLSLAGPEVDSAVKYGDLTIDEAVDDTGTSLVSNKKEVFNDPKKFRDFNNAFFRKSSFGNTQPSAPQIELTLAVPKRSATKIARLRGTFSLASAGTEKTIELAGLKGAGKKKMDIPASANLSITVDAGSDDNVRELKIELTGDEGALESLDVLDASGQKVSTGMSSWSMANGPVHRSIDLSRPLDGSTKLVAKIATDRKLTKVNFDIKDIFLP